MRKTILLLTLCFLVTLFSGPLLAQDPIVYPAKGQNNQQMEKDKYDCYQWAKKQSGFDPMATPKATAPPPQPKAEGSTAGSAVKGGLIGAGAGAAIGAIAGDAGAGAAIGAIGGGLFELNITVHIVPALKVVDTQSNNSADKKREDNYYEKTEY